MGTPQAALPGGWARFNPASQARARFRRWWQGRLPLSDLMTLSQRNVYILPTRPGWMLAATLLVLLLASINYQLNLGYLLTFLLAGCAVAGMHVGHATLSGLSMRLQPPAPTFCGQVQPLEVVLDNPRKTPRHGIGLAVLDSADWVWTDVPAQGQSVLHLAFCPSQRGLHRVPVLSAETRFPLGTFRVWTIWRPAAQVLVYPRPEAAAPPLPPGQARDQAPALAAGLTRGQEYDGVRAYRRGDPMRQVVWKKAATALATGSAALVSRDSAPAPLHELWLDHASLSALPPEARWSRLCAWVLAADTLGLHFGLRLPQREIPLGTGPAHRQQCLEALALC